LRHSATVRSSSTSFPAPAETRRSWADCTPTPKRFGAPSTTPANQLSWSGHSSAGIVISEVADHPSIAHTVYLAAFWLPRGKSLIDMLGAGPPPDWWSVRDDGAAQVSDDIEVVREALCADADPQLAEAGIRRLVLQAVASFTTPSAAPDRTHPTTYIILENDGAVPPAAQEQMAAAADHIERLPSSHQPMISMPDRLAQVLAQVR
jgi:hypothetical protein